MKKAWALALILVLILAACTPTEKPVQIGSVIDTLDFENAGTFEEGTYGNTNLRITGGTYHITTPNNSIIWGQGGTNHNDVSIEVQAQASTSDSDYGVMCRADPANTGNGYLFTIADNGSYGIWRGDSDAGGGGSYRGLASGSAPSGVVTDGQNTIRVVCVGNYLALYANGRFLASAEDSTYTSGLVGLAGRAGDSGATELIFDNLTVSGAQLQ